MSHLTLALTHRQVVNTITEHRGPWQVSYPETGRVVVRPGADRRSYGLQWWDGTDLRVKGVSFTETNGVIAATDETGRTFALYERAKLPQEGVTRCSCGSKYWDTDGTCHSCCQPWDGVDHTPT